jgi:CBS domain-containing protein
MTVDPVPAPAILGGLKQALRPHVPFGAMDEADLDRIVRTARLRYFAPGETILQPAEDRPAHCYIVKQGAVRGERPGPAGSATGLWELAAGEMFPLGALLAHRGVTSIYRAVRDTFCLEFPVEEFDALMARSHVFRDACTRRLAHLLDLLRTQLHAEYAAGITEQRGFATPLSDLLHVAPVVVPPGEPLGRALSTMEDKRIGSLPVVDGAGRPAGIFTRQDVVGRVVLPQRPLDTQIGAVMSAPPIALPGTATAGDAALAMAQHGIRHVIVTNIDGRVAGVVSERDLFALQRLSVRELASSIRRAPDLPTLVHCAADIRALSNVLVAQGMGSASLTRLIASLNDRLTVRVIEVVLQKFDVDGIALCWLGMGSEGREEQTIATDQDNGLLFVTNDAQANPDVVRQRLHPFARAVNHALDRCGYPLCKGGVMAMNPQWCLSLQEWQAAFAQWIDRGDPESLLAASIFFDFRALWGHGELARTLRSGIATHAAANPRFLKQMTDNALRNRPPLSWRGEIATREDGAGAEGIDLKRLGSMPVTDGARIYALASGVVATNTQQRLRTAGPRVGIGEDDLRSWLDTFDYLQLLRLRTQHRRIAGELPPSGDANFVPLASLSSLDRRILKESLRQVRKLQQRLILDYP